MGRREILAALFAKGSLCDSLSFVLIVDGVIQIFLQKLQIFVKRKSKTGFTLRIGTLSPIQNRLKFSMRNADKLIVQATREVMDVKQQIQKYLADKVKVSVIYTTELPDLYWAVQVDDSGEFWLGWRGRPRI